MPKSGSWEHSTATIQVNRHADKSEDVNYGQTTRRVSDLMGSVCLFWRNNSETVKVSSAPLCFLVHALIGPCQLPVTHSAAESVRAHGVQSCSDAVMPPRGEASAHPVGVENHGKSG